LTTRGLGPCRLQRISISEWKTARPAGDPTGFPQVQLASAGGRSMYNISDIVEMGDAHAHILSTIKDLLVVDDTEPISLTGEEAFEV